MPFCQCPRCKAVFTIQVADEKAWRAEKWPNHSASELPPETCPACAEKALERMEEMGGTDQSVFKKR